jgi:murein DD-endopeptidase MepM/ murein hydrolase activator NlpD
MNKTLQNKGKVARLALVGVATVWLGGCADSSRLNDPFADPFAKSARVDHAPTGTIAQAPAQQSGGGFFSEAFRTFDDKPRPPENLDPQPQQRYTPPRPAAAIQSEPLAPPRAAAAVKSVPNPASWSAPKPIAAPVQHAATLARPAAAGGSNWSAEGGTPVVLAQGESAEIIAQRYGVPTATLLNVNGYRTSAQVQPGARLVIPVYHASGARSAALAPVEAAPRVEEPRMVAAPKPVATPKLAAAPKSLAAPQVDAAAVLAEKRARLAQAKAAEATQKAAEAKLQADAKAAKLAAAKPAAIAATPAVIAAKPAVRQQVAVAAPGPALTPAQPVASKFEKTKAPQVDAATPTASLQPVNTLQSATSEPASGDAANPEFRWPARGRVIQAFGAAGNDGINIAVPEGTQVKAAEGGVVAYAGSELKGYGNLVLIRHPNGFVSAYANNGSINVKRGDAVKRGQTIALSGQTGNVASPQLHFELRKGSKPVDPSSYLAGL